MLDTRCAPREVNRLDLGTLKLRWQQITNRCREASSTHWVRRRNTCRFRRSFGVEVTTRLSKERIEREFTRLARSTFATREQVRHVVRLSELTQRAHALRGLMRHDHATAHFEKDDLLPA
jgi:hypothetical protein